MVLGILQSCFVIKLTATFSVEAAIFLVSPIKQHSITELLAYVEILNDALYPHVVMSVADYASILRRYCGFKDTPQLFKIRHTFGDFLHGKPLCYLEQLCSQIIWPSRYEAVKNSIWKLWHRACT